MYVNSAANIKTKNGTVDERKLMLVNQLHIIKFQCDQLVEYELKQILCFLWIWIDCKSSPKWTHVEWLVYVYIIHQIVGNSWSTWTRYTTRGDKIHYVWQVNRNIHIRIIECDKKVSVRLLMNHCVCAGWNMLRFKSLLKCKQRNFIRSFRLLKDQTHNKYYFNETSIIHHPEHKKASKRTKNNYQNLIWWVRVLSAHSLTPFAPSTYLIVICTHSRIADFFQNNFEIAKK